MAAAPLGILVYVDNTASMIEEFLWLYKSVIYSGLYPGSRFIVACHPDAIASLPADERIDVIPSVPHSQTSADWSGYPYINSVANLADPRVLDACRSFDFILKTDCDTFVTPALKHFRPSGLCFGFGAYAYEESVRRKLSECSARWGFPHSGVHNVGASVLGPAQMVEPFLVAQMDACKRLLKEEFADFAGVWPGWCKQVITMYAGELALRTTFPQRCSIGLLDHFTSAERTLASDVLHIHAWHTDSYWSKHRFRDGAYAAMSPETIDRNTLGGYCHWLAISGIDEVRREAARRA